MKRNIIKAILTMCGVLFALGASADGLYISNFNALPNTATTVSVKMKNTNTISGYQFDLVLPSGVTLNSATTSTSRTSYNYSITQKTQSDGSIRIFCIASGSASAVFTGTDGEVLKLSLTSTGTGDKTLTLKNQILTESDLDEIEPTTATTTMHVHALTATAAKAATCSAAGNKAYWYCSGCKKYYSNSTATTETTLAAMTIAATGHNYGTPAWTWSDDGKTASAVITCSNDKTHTLSGNATVTSAVKTAATCTAKGTTTYTAKITLNGTAYTSTKDVEDIAATGHTYSTTPTWNWTGLTSATASFACTKGDDTQTVNATITNAVTKSATCEAAGVRTYTAKATFSGKEYTDTKTEAIAATGHNYGTPVWTWSDDGKTASAVITCSNDKSHTLSGNATVTGAVKTAATCTAKGTTTYTAKITLNGTAYTSTKDVEDIAATGHTYSTTPTWNWTGLTSATASFACTKGDDTQTVTATITNAVTTAATDTKAGVRTYTATVSFGGKTYTDTKTEEIPATGHTYGAPVWTWTGYTSAKATFTCTGNDDTQEVTATITNVVTTAATCETAGVRTYTAKATFQNKEYTDTKTEAIAATGHTYGDAVWTWNGTASASAKITCANDAGHVLSGDATVTSAVKTAATCTTKGTTTYTAKVTLNGTEYTDSKDAEDIDALGHDLSSVDNGNGTHTTTCSRCDYSVTEEHTFANGVCSVCGAAETIEDTDISTYDNVIYADNVEMCAGGNVTLSIKMKNNVGMTGYQFNLYAPSGFDLSTATATRTKTRKDDNVSFSKSVQTDGSYKVVCYTSDNETFSGNDGEVCTITFTIPQGYAVGNYPIYITNQRLTAGGTTYNVDDKIKSTLTVKDYILGDANSNSEVEVGDLSAIVGFILNTNVIATFNEQAADANCNKEVEVGDLSTIVKMILGVSNAKSTSYQTSLFNVSVPQISLCPGDETTLYVQMQNTNMSGFQFDINLPEGLVCTGITPMLSRMSNNHFFGYSSINENISRVLCYSPTNSNIVGASGNIVAVNIKADKNMECGDYDFTLSNIYNTEGQRISSVTSKVSVSNPTGIREIISNEPNVSMYDINGRMVNVEKTDCKHLPKGVYIINGKKYVNK